MLLKAKKEKKLRVDHYAVFEGCINLVTLLKRFFQPLFILCTWRTRSKVSEYKSELTMFACVGYVMLSQ